MASAGCVPLRVPWIANFNSTSFPSGPWDRPAAGALEPARLTHGWGPRCVRGPQESGQSLSAALWMDARGTDHSMDIGLGHWYQSVCVCYLSCGPQIPASRKPTKGAQTPKCLNQIPSLCFLSLCCLCIFGKLKKSGVERVGVTVCIVLA